MVLFIAFLYILFCVGIGAFVYSTFRKANQALFAILAITALVAFIVPYLQTIEFSRIIDNAFYRPFYEVIDQIIDFHDEYTFFLVAYLGVVATGYALLGLAIRWIKKRKDGGTLRGRSLWYFAALTAASLAFFVYTIEEYDYEIAVAVKDCNFIGHERYGPGGIKYRHDKCSQRLEGPISPELSHLPERFRFREPDELWDGNVSMHTSPDNTKSVTASIDACYRIHNDDGTLSSECFQSYYVNVAYERKGPRKGVLRTIFPPRVENECTIADLPIGWTKDSAFVIFEKASLTPCDNSMPGIFRAWNVEKGIFLDVKKEDVKTFIENPPDLSSIENIPFEVSDKETAIFLENGLLCVPRGNYVIRTQEDYDQLISPFCKGQKMDIDFTIFTLLGRFDRIPNCQTTSLYSIIRDTQSHRVFFLLQETSTQKCSYALPEVEWAMIPKLNPTDTVEFPPQNSSIIEFALSSPNE